MSEFHVGDKVYCVDESGSKMRDDVSVVAELIPSCDGYRLRGEDGESHGYWTSDHLISAGGRASENTAPTIKDSGERTAYDTGAVRDCKEGKGRFDLMPLDVMANIAEMEPIMIIADFKKTGSVYRLYNAISNFVEFGSNFGDVFSAMLEVGKHFEEGAKKYGPNNWQKGIPVSSYIDSAVRHYLKYRAGWKDEPHDRAFVWNLMCCIWTMEHHPEMDDWTVEGQKKAGDGGC